MVIMFHFTLGVVGSTSQSSCEREPVPGEQCGCHWKVRLPYCSVPAHEKGEVQGVQLLRPLAFCTVEGSVADGAVPLISLWFPVLFHCQSVLLSSVVILSHLWLIAGHGTDTTDHKDHGYGVEHPFSSPVSWPPRRWIHNLTLCNCSMLPDKKSITTSAPNSS